MSINATTSSISSTTSTSQVSSASTTESTKSKSDSSFKDEMDKVSSSEKSKETDKNSEVSKKEDKSTVAEKKSDKEQSDKEEDTLLKAEVDYSNYGSQSIADANTMLSNDIRQMMNSNFVSTIDEVSSDKNSLTLDYTNSLSMTQSDAEFFLNLTQTNDVSGQNIVAQAQTMLENGANVQEVVKSSQISQTLLNAINEAREKNQPLRIDFDQNVSVILRFGKNNSISANFIPGDKAVEQYLKNNIETLKSTFNEKNLSYSDLSYQSRGSKQQRENRRNRQQ